MIKHIDIRGFKSLADVSVDLDPVTVLVGRSGTGKSNFVQAVRFLREFLSTGIPTVAANSLGGLERISTVPGNGNSIRFAVRFDVPRINGEYLYELELGPGKARAMLAPPTSIHRESLRIGETTIFAHQGGNWISKPNTVPMPEPGPRPMLGILYAIQEAKIAHTALTRGIGCYDFPSSVLQNPQPAQHFTGTDLGDDGKNFAPTLETIANNLNDLATFQTIISALTQVVASVRGVTIEPAGDSGRNQNQGPRVWIGHDANGLAIPFELSQESEGFRRVLAHLLAIYQSPSKQTLIFEEPEKGIYPGALALLAEHFKHAPSDGRGQVILTTHSPELLDHFPPEAIRVVELENYATKIGPLKSEQREQLREHLLQAGELLTVVDAQREEPTPASAGSAQ